MARALEITKGAARSYTVPVGDTAAALRQHGPVPLQLRRLSATHPLVARARGKDEFDKDSTDRATLCDCARAQHRYQVPQGLAFVSCAHLAIITRASARMMTPSHNTQRSRCLARAHARTQSAQGQQSGCRNCVEAPLRSV